ncbi:unnamed protein product [Ambrosiozyma monospora]|uniref:Unnamed protein product n=1 Tax=Ambrosiozyma monospora TaxID=43982 RepID=A0ACB5T2M1_AMBMO|nr:unnamed protein product [Ambrosiozyma monospora]
MCQVVKKMLASNLVYGLLSEGSHCFYLKPLHTKIVDDLCEMSVNYCKLRFGDPDLPIGYVLTMLLLKIRKSYLEMNDIDNDKNEDMRTVQLMWDQVIKSPKDNK